MAGFLRQVHALRLALDVSVHLPLPAAVDTNLDNGDDEDDTCMVEDTIGAAPATAPFGFKYINECPPLESDDDLKRLIGKYILHAFDQEASSAGLSARWWRGVFQLAT